MDIEAGLVASIKTREDILFVMDAGITASFFERYTDIYSAIITHYKKYKTAINEDTLSSLFPNFKAPNESEPLEFYVDAIKADHKKRLIKQGLSEAIDAVKKNPDEAERILQKVILQSKTEIHSSNDLDVRERVERRKDDYLVKKDKLGVDGLSTSWDSLDNLTGGYHPGDLVTFIAEPKRGKGIRLEEELPTPKGFKKARDVKVGDFLIGSNGLPTKVTFVSEIHNIPCYRITFNDGTNVVVDEQHRWSVYEHKRSPREATSKVMTTLAMYKTGVKKITSTQIRSRFAIQLTEPVNYCEKKLPVHPYLLGYWLGDGTATRAEITVGDQDIEEVANIFNTFGVPMNIVSKSGGVHLIYLSGGKGTTIQTQLRHIGVLGNKHIPDIYKTASVSQRLDLLRGLMDSDGTSSSKSPVFYNTNKALCEDVLELVCSLGGKGTIYPKITYYNGSRCDSYQVVMQLPQSVFYLERKRFEERLLQRPYRYITDINLVNSEPTVCFTVDAEDSLFLITRNYIVTHNTWFLTWQSHYIWKHERVPVLILTREMRPEAIQHRFDAIECKIPYDSLRRGLLTNEQEAKYFKYLKDIEEDPIPYIVLGYSLHEGGATVSSIIPKVERHLLNGGALFVDGIYLMEDDRGENDWRGIVNIAKDLKNLAQSYKIPVITSTQAQIQGKGYIPNMENIAYGKYIAQFVDALLSISQDPEAKIEEASYIHLLAQREGDVGTFKVGFQFNPYCDFSERTYKTIDDEEEDYEI